MSRHSDSRRTISIRMFLGGRRGPGSRLVAIVAYYQAQYRAATGGLSGGQKKVPLSGSGGRPWPVVDWTLSRTEGREKQEGAKSDRSPVNDCLAQANSCDGFDVACAVP